MFKVCHGIGPKYMQALITKSDCPYSTRNAKRVELPKYKSVRYGYNSFTYNGAFIWNNLPNEIKQEFGIYGRDHNVNVLHVNLKFKNDVTQI